MDRFGQFIGSSHFLSLPPSVVSFFHLFFSFLRDCATSAAEQICRWCSAPVADAKYKLTKDPNKHIQKASLLNFPNDLSILRQYFFPVFVPSQSFFLPPSSQGNHLSHIHLYKLISSLQEKIKSTATEIPVSEV